MPTFKKPSLSDYPDLAALGDGWDLALAHTMRVWERMPFTDRQLDFWPTDIAIQRLVDFDRRARGLAPEFIPELRDLTAADATKLYAKAFSCFLADIAASPDSVRLSKARDILDMAKKRKSIEGLDGLFMTALGVFEKAGDVEALDPALQLLQSLSPQKRLSGARGMTMVYDVADKKLTSLGLDGLNSLLGGGANTVKPGEKINAKVGKANAFSPYNESVPESECQKNVKYVGGVIGGVAAAASAAAAAKQYAKAPTPVAAVAGKLAYEPGKKAGEAAGAELAKVVCGGATAPAPPKEKGDPEPMPVGGPQMPPPSSQKPEKPAPKQPGAPQDPPDPPPSAGPKPAPNDGGNGDGSPPKKKKGDAVAEPAKVMMDPEDGRDPSRRGQYGIRPIIIREVNPDIREPRSTGAPGNYDMVVYPRLVDVDGGGVAGDLGVYAGLLKALFPEEKEPPITIVYPEDPDPH